MSIRNRPPEIRVHELCLGPGSLMLSCTVQYSEQITLDPEHINLSVRIVKRPTVDITVPYFRLQLAEN